MTLIRTTFEPDREVEVGDAELLDLRRQGLVYEDAKATKARHVAAAASEKGDD